MLRFSLPGSWFILLPLRQWTQFSSWDLAFHWNDSFWKRKQKTKQKKEEWKRKWKMRRGVDPNWTPPRSDMANFKKMVCRFSLNICNSVKENSFLFFYKCAPGVYVQSFVPGFTSCKACCLFSTVKLHAGYITREGRFLPDSETDVLHLGNLDWKGFTHIGKFENNPDSIQSDYDID